MKNKRYQNLSPMSFPLIFVIIRVLQSLCTFVGLSRSLHIYCSSSFVLQSLCICIHLFVVQSLLHMSYSSSSLHICYISFSNLLYARSFLLCNSNDGGNGMGAGGSQRRRASDGSTFLLSFFFMTTKDDGREQWVRMYMDET